MLGAVGLQAPAGLGVLGARGAWRWGPRGSGVGTLRAARPGGVGARASAAKWVGWKQELFLELSSREGGGWEKCSRKKVALA